MKIVRLKPLKMPKKNAVKAKDTIKSTPVSTAPKPMKIHGHMTIELTDKEEVKQPVEEEKAEIEPQELTKEEEKMTAAEILDALIKTANIVPSEENEEEDQDEAER